MQLPEPPPARRNLWQTSLFFAAMIAFLVFSDWANPSQTIIEKTDGTQMQVAVLIGHDGDATACSSRSRSAI